MPIPHIRSILATLVLVVFAAQIVDTTTGQPMPKLTVTFSGAMHRTLTSDAQGRVKVSDLKAGAYTIRVESKDVPPQEFHVSLKPGETLVTTMKVCSTTLDYHCGTPGGGGGS